MSAIQLVTIFAILAIVSGFSPSRSTYGRKATVSTTQIYEDFNMDFMKPDFNPKIITQREIFSEKQLREFTATYYDDTRSGVLDGVINFVKGIFGKKEESESEESPALVKSLKPTVSIAVLEEKTAQFVKGKSDAKTYYGVLKAAFGDKLPSVLPQILANLPDKKAADLSKVSR